MATGPIWAYPIVVEVTELSRPSGGERSELRPRPPTEDTERGEVAVPENSSSPERYIQSIDTIAAEMCQFSTDIRQEEKVWKARRSSQPK